MRFKDLVPLQVDETLIALTDRPTRRFGRNPRNTQLSGGVRTESIALEQSGVRRDREARRYSEARQQVLKRAKTLAARGIYGFYFRTGQQPLTVWWYQSVSWRVTDLNRFIRSQAFRSSSAARGAVKFSWSGDVLGERELAVIEQALGQDFIRQGDVTITKDDFQTASGVKRPPVGTKAVRGRWSIKTAPGWPPEDEQD